MSASITALLREKLSYPVVHTPRTNEKNNSPDDFPELMLEDLSIPSSAVSFHSRALSKYQSQVYEHLHQTFRIVCTKVSLSSHLQSRLSSYHKASDKVGYLYQLVWYRYTEKDEHILDDQSEEVNEIIQLIIQLGLYQLHWSKILDKINCTTNTHESMHEFRADEYLELIKFTLGDDEDTKTKIETYKKQLIYLLGASPSGKLDNYTLDDTPSSKLSSPPQRESSAKKMINLIKWLHHQANQISSSLSFEELLQSIHQICKASRDSMSLQSALFDLIGVEGFDWIQEIIEKQNEIKQLSVVDLLCPPKEKEKKKKRPSNAESTWLEDSQYNPQVMQNQRLEALLDNARHAASSETIGADSQLRQAFGKDMEFEYHHQKKGAGGSENTIREQTEWYEKVVVLPPSEKYVKDIDLVPITELQPDHQQVFSGITHFNPLQSHVFPKAYGSQENLLICAPTGAGKTNVAMLTILQQLKWSKDCKMIYIAPLKALAQEVVTKFSKLLKPLGLQVAELTGDMQLTKYQIEQTHLIVTTPEKWDVITRKASNGALMQKVKVLIIDEVHLLADERGSVIETIVARTLRFIESSQSMIRIVALSATLPNYKDVAKFLRVHPKEGLFHFPASFRPVPLTQTFFGIFHKKTKTRAKYLEVENKVAYETARDAIRDGYQVMIFVHSRKDTSATCKVLRELSAEEGTLDEFYQQENWTSQLVDRLRQSRNGQVREHGEYGFGIHHAGMLRQDRNLVEDLFAAGAIQVLCCTATLAWGVNLPAHTVIIKGTQVYHQDQGKMLDLSMLDVMQIFGRAGRPQYDTTGDAFMITSQTSVQHYLGLITQQTPIESSLIKALPDHLNAEIASGTVTSMKEAKSWLSFTYLYVRMVGNPMAYGITYEEKENDPRLDQKRTELLSNAIQTLEQTRMITSSSPSRVRSATSGHMDRSLNHHHHHDTSVLNTDEEDDQLKFFITRLGRVASHYYLTVHSIETFNDMMHPKLRSSQILHLFCSAAEFEQIQVRQDEVTELEQLQRQQICPIPFHSSVDTSAGKTCVLLQTYITQYPLKSFSLISDMNYVASNASRIARGIFEIALQKGWGSVARECLTFAKSLDHRVWHFQLPFHQFSKKKDRIHAIEQAFSSFTWEQLQQCPEEELASRLKHNQPLIQFTQHLLKMVPSFDIQLKFYPLSQDMLRLHVTLQCDFEWNARFHSKTMEHFYLWIEDADSGQLYHWESFSIHIQRQDERMEFEIEVPLFQPLSSSYLCCVFSDRWLGSEQVFDIGLENLKLPQTSKLMLEWPNAENGTTNSQHEAVPVTVLGERSSWFCASPGSPATTHFSSMISHTMLKALMDNAFNVFLSIPFKSKQQEAIELLMLSCWKDANGNQENKKVVFLVPFSSCFRSCSYKRWTDTLKQNHKFVTFYKKDFDKSDVIFFTFQEWSRFTHEWTCVDFVKHNIGLIVVDEFHLMYDSTMKDQAGQYLEVVISRLRQLSFPTRVACLTTRPIANVSDVCHWLDIPRSNCFNFNFQTRAQVFSIQSFPGKHYCPRMKSMNKPIYHAIQSHIVECQQTQVLIYVASRRQTRDTANALVTLLANDTTTEATAFLTFANPTAECLFREELHLVQDPALRSCLSFGIGFIHNGLSRGDRTRVERLAFEYRCLTILLSTFQYVWTWSTSFHPSLVVVKGTERYDVEVQHYRQVPMSEIYQMIQLEEPERSQVVLMVDETKKNYYQKAFTQPLTLESSFFAMDDFIPILWREMQASRVLSIAQGQAFLESTFWFQRFHQNPLYYTNKRSLNEHDVGHATDETMHHICEILQSHQCIIYHAKQNTLKVTDWGHIGDRYQLHYQTVGRLTSLVIQDSSSSFTSRREKKRYWIEHLTGAWEFQQVFQGTSSSSSSSAPQHLSPYQLKERAYFESTLNASVMWPIASCQTEMPFWQLKAFLLFQTLLQKHVDVPSEYEVDRQNIVEKVHQMLLAMIDIASSVEQYYSTKTFIQLIPVLQRTKKRNASPEVSFHIVEEQQDAKKPKWNLDVVFPPSVKVSNPEIPTKFWCLVSRSRKTQRRVSSTEPRLLQCLTFPASTLEQRLPLDISKTIPRHEVQIEIFSNSIVNWTTALTLPSVNEKTNRK